MKSIRAGIFIMFLVAQVILQAIVFGIFWGINHFFSTEILYLIPAVTLFVISALIFLAQFLILKGSHKQMKAMDAEFERDRERMFKRRI